MNLKEFTDIIVLERITEVISRNDLSNEQKANVIKFIIEC